MLGRAAVAIWFDTTAQARAELEEWHSHEHMPERLRIPGFLRGTRWIALSGEPSYFVLYEAARLAVLTSGPYLEGGPTEEQKIRGGDAPADRVLLIGGYDPAAVESAARELSPRGATIGLYRLAYCLTSRDKA